MYSWTTIMAGFQWWRCIIALCAVLVLGACKTSNSNHDGDEYSNRWVIKVPAGKETAQQVADDYGYQFIREIFDDYYSLKHNLVSKRSIDSNGEFHQRLQEDARVEEAHQQIAKDMTTKETVTVKDAQFRNQWYLSNDDRGLWRSNVNFESGFVRYQEWDHNVKAAWEQCLNGKGITIAIVDDGLHERNPDILSNYRSRRSYNVLGKKTRTHGTKCASVAAGVKNKFCGTGVAFKARISDITILGDVFTDDVEASGFSHTRNYVDIYSCSYGPGDNGYSLGSIGSLAKQAIKMGAESGRKGKGNIFVWSAGNGGISQDSCAYDEYVNSIYSISVSSWGRMNKPLRGSERCSAIMVATYSRDKGDKSVPMVAAEGVAGCTDEFSGSSASTPIVSGTIALALQANSNLTWRDVQYLIVYSSNSDIPSKSLDNNARKGATINGKGLRVSPLWGFGLLDAGRLVEMAKQWKNVGEQSFCEISFDTEGNSFISSEGREYSTHVSGWYSASRCRIESLEHVELYIDATYCVRGFLKAEVQSPDGTKSVLLPGRINDRRTTEINWSSMSVHFWGESSSGEWKIKLSNMNYEKARSCTGDVRSLSLKLYGTEEYFSLDNHLDKTINVMPQCNVQVQAQKPDHSMVYNNSAIQMNLTVVVNSTATLPFLITPSAHNVINLPRLTWWKTLPYISHNRLTIHVQMDESTDEVKWFGEFKRNSNKASLDKNTGTLTINRAQLSDTDRYYYDLNPRGDKVTTNVVINLKVVTGEEECVDEFENIKNNVKLRLASHQFRRHPWDIDEKECSQQCFWSDRCRSITMMYTTRKAEGICDLNYVKWGDPGITTVYNKDAVYHGRKCAVETIRTTRAPNRWTRPSQTTPPVSAATTICLNEFYAERPTFALKVRQRDSLQQLTDVPDISSCKSRCLRYDECRSVTYQASRRKCYLNKVNNRDDSVQLSRHMSMTLVDRDCSGLSTIATTTTTSTPTTTTPVPTILPNRQASIVCLLSMYPEVNNKALVVNQYDIIRVLRTDTVGRCKEECLADSRCRSVNFKTSDRRCTLNKVNKIHDGARDEFDFGNLMVERYCGEFTTTTTATPFQTTGFCLPSGREYSHRLIGAMGNPDGDGLKEMEDCLRICCNDRSCKSVTYMYYYDNSRLRCRCWKHNKSFFELSEEGRIRTTSLTEGDYRMVDIRR